MSQQRIYISESLTEGHPDKLCDQISDAVVDHLLMQDPCARVRAECAVARAIVFIAARFASSANIDFAWLARKVIQRIGYDHPDFNPRTCSIITSPLALASRAADQFDADTLTDAQIEAIPARNQVTVFGFACNQTPERMPLPITLAHRIARQLSRARKEQMIPGLMPDARVQVGVAYKGLTPQSIYSITIEAHLDEKGAPDPPTLLEAIMKLVIMPAAGHGAVTIDARTRIAVNPEGPYSGGPMHHSGLTGRKTAVDAYGDYARQSSKALSGKDPLRIDRIGAYAARYVAKNIVAAGLAEECEVMLSYATGLARPITLTVQTFGTGRLPDQRLSQMIEANFDLRPAAILKQFRLRQLPAAHPTGFFQHLAAYGHFGRNDLDLPWEKTDKAHLLESTAS